MLNERQSSTFFIEVNELTIDDEPCYGLHVLATEGSQMLCTHSPANGLNLLLSDDTDHASMSRLLKELDGALAIAQGLDFEDTAMLIRASRTRAIAEIVDRVY